MANINLGPASTNTPSTLATMIPVNTQINSTPGLIDGFRCLAYAKALNISQTGDIAFLPIINSNALCTQTPSAIFAANPLYLLNGQLVAGSAAALTMSVNTGPNVTGTSIVASATTTTLTGAGATSNFFKFTVANIGYYSLSTWGPSGGPSNGLYINVTTASAVATQMDFYFYALDMS